MVMHVATWDGVIGGPESAPTVISPDSQLNLSATLSTFGGYVDLTPDNGGWLLWNLHLWPTADRTDGGSVVVLDEIIAGTHDAKLQLLGARLKSAFVATGHPIAKLVVCPCSEANRRGPFQVFSSSATKWQSAVTRAINQLRTGAAEPNLRVMTVIARTPNIGAWSTWVPTNISAVGMTFAPGVHTNSQAQLDKYLDGTLDSGYGYTTDLNNYSQDKGIPMALAKWGPRYEWGATVSEQQACPIADLVVNDVYNKLVDKYRARFLCDCMSVSALLDLNGYQGTDTPGKEAWARACTNFKTLWSGTKLP